MMFAQGNGRAGEDARSSGPANGVADSRRNRYFLFGGREGARVHAMEIIRQPLNT
jgi:hypothetical protein